MTMINIAADLKKIVSDSRDWLLSFDEDVVRHKPKPERWSIAEVIGHLIDSACNNHQRFIRAQEADELTFPKYDQNAWVAGSNYHQCDWSNVVQLWFLYNMHLAHVIEQIPDGQLTTPCTITPYETCTLGFLVQDYLDHLNHHLEKIRERTASD